MSLKVITSLLLTLMSIPMECQPSYCPRIVEKRLRIYRFFYDNGTESLRFYDSDHLEFPFEISSANMSLNVRPDTPFELKKVSHKSLYKFNLYDNSEKRSHFCTYFWVRLLHLFVENEMTLRFDYRV